MKKEDITVEVIDAKKAKEYLDKNIYHNRRISPHSLLQYSTMMQKKQWIPNGDTVKFDVDGKLIDGQHRLSAVLKTGVPMETIVVRNLPREAFNTLDFGKKRSAGDVLCTRGLSYTQNIAASVRIVLSLRGLDNITPAAITSIRNKITTPDIIDYVLTNEDIAKDAQYVRTRYRTACRLLTSSVAVALYHIFRQIDEKLCTEFFSKLNGTLNIDVNEPLFKLREKLILRFNSESEILRQYKMLWPVQCWNIMRGEKDTGEMLKLDFEINKIK
jgi:hypothetical protein